MPQQDPRGRQWWWIGAAGPEQDAGPGTDFHAVRTGHISITPIHVDLTRYQALEQVASWVGGLAARWSRGAGMSLRMRLQPEAIGHGHDVPARARPAGRAAARRNSGGIRDERVLNAIRTVPRHLFVDEALATRAYEDTALPIGHGQTISQPWVVARMTEALLRGRARRSVLEIGTGSGYQAAVLAALGLEVHTVERIGELLRTARKRFRQLGLNVRSKHDDGRIGWPENGPFDAIIVTAAAPALVDALTAQLAPGGRLVAPVGGASSQSLLQLDKAADGQVTQWNWRRSCSCRCYRDGGLSGTGRALNPRSPGVRPRSSRRQARQSYPASTTSALPDPLQGLHRRMTCPPLRHLPVLACVAAAVIAAVSAGCSSTVVREPGGGARARRLSRSRRPAPAPP